MECYPYLCSWLQQICCAKLTLRIYWLVVVVRQFRNFSTILWWVQVNFQWEDGEVRLHWIGFFHSASSLKQQSAGRPIASIGHVILIPSQRSHVKVVHQLKIHKKNVFLRFGSIHALILLIYAINQYNYVWSTQNERK